MEKYFLYVILLAIIPTATMEEPKKITHSTMSDPKKYELITEESITITYAATFGNELDLRASQCTKKDTGTQEYSAVECLSNGMRVHLSPLQANEYFNRMQYIYRLGQHKEHKNKVCIEKIAGKK